MCDCIETAVKVTGPVPVQGCASVTVETLDLYLSQVQGCYNGGRYAAAGTNTEELTNAISILSKWKTVKVETPESCRYHEYLPVMQDLVRRIILS